MTFNETQKRWYDFLQKIEARFQEIVEKSEAVLPLLFEATDLETITFTNAWQGIYSQASDLIYKIQDTWDERVEEAFENAGIEFGSNQFIQERNKGYQVKFNLQQKLKTYEVRIFATAANKLMQKVKEILSRDFCCTQCQAPLMVKDNFFRSYYSTCEYCQTVNTFEPGTKARNIEHFAMDALGEAAALDYCIKYEELKFQNYLEDKKVNKKELLVTEYQKYVEVYLKKRIEIIPDYSDRYKKDLEAKMALVSYY